jgi:hypothetical protein
VLLGPGAILRLPALPFAPELENVRLLPFFQDSMIASSRAVFVLWSLLLVLQGCTHPPSDQRADAMEAFLKAPEAGANDLRFHASTVLVPGRQPWLRTTVQLTNTADHDVKVSLPGACEISLAVFPRERSSAAPAWDQDRLEQACAFQDLITVLGPGATVDAQGRALLVRDILGDSLPEGIYSMVTRVGVSTPRLELPSGTVMLKRR